MKLIFLSLFLLSTKAFGFGGELHIKITEKALIPHGFSAEVANSIGKSNVWVDETEPLNSASHVDSESFEAASELMKNRLKQAAQFLIAGDLKQARHTFGNITHTVQDFFSHSNYVEFMAPQEIDLLHLTNPLRSVKCSKDNKKDGLTTGYFPDETTPEGKCSHGVLNKDGGMIYIPHYQAAKYAEVYTAKMYESFKQEVLSMTGSEMQTKRLLDSFKDVEHSGMYQSTRGETARASIKVYPSPQKKGEEINVTFSSEQFCELFQVDVIDILGRIMGVNGGNPYLYKGPIDKDETKIMTMTTENLVPAMYILRAEFSKCEGNGKGNQVFKFLIVN